jgi:RHS repeat-associated protein
MKEDYSYDAAGNRFKLTVVTSVRSTESISEYYANSNYLKTDGKYAFTYDNAGNLVGKCNKYTIDGDNVTFNTTAEGVEYWQYRYDLMNRLVAVKRNGPVIAEYAYDPNGLRVVKRANGETIHYVFEGTEPLFKKWITSGKIRSYVYAAGKHLARVDGEIGNSEAPVYYYHNDHLGNVKAVTDIHGTMVWSADYTAFGNRFKINAIDGFEQEFGQTGKEYDPDVELYYFNARWYDPELGRFISEDPAKDGSNWYIYCGNNPLVFIDPTGLDFWGSCGNFFSNCWSSVVDFGAFAGGFGVGVGNFIGNTTLGMLDLATLWIPSMEHQDMINNFVDGTANLMLGLVLDPAGTIETIGNNLSNAVDTWNTQYLTSDTFTQGQMFGDLFCKVGTAVYAAADLVALTGQIGSVFAEGSLIADAVSLGRNVDGLVTDMGYAARFGDLYAAGGFVDDVGEYFSGLNGLGSSEITSTTALTHYRAWPSAYNGCNMGFLGGYYETETFQTGEIFSRIGGLGDTAHFVSPLGTTLSERGLPSTYPIKNETLWQVNQPFGRLGGIAGGWLDSTGFGIQYYTQYSMDYLIQNKFISQLPTIPVNF